MTLSLEGVCLEGLPPSLDGPPGRQQSGPPHLRLQVRGLDPHEPPLLSPPIHLCSVTSIVLGRGAVAPLPGSGAEGAGGGDGSPCARPQAPLADSLAPVRGVCTEVELSLLRGCPTSGCKKFLTAGCLGLVAGADHPRGPWVAVPGQPDGDVGLAPSGDLSWPSSGRSGGGWLSVSLPWRRLCQQRCVYVVCCSCVRSSCWACCLSLTSLSSVTGAWV